MNTVGKRLAVGCEELRIQEEKKLWASYPWAKRMMRVEKGYVLFESEEEFAQFRDRYRRGK